MIVVKMLINADFQSRSRVSEAKSFQNKMVPPITEPPIKEP